MQGESSKNSEESQNLVKRPERIRSGLATVDIRHLQWTWEDLSLAILRVMIIFGDFVEIYLPGIITKKVSSELKVSLMQEAFLGIIFYILMAAGSVFFPLVKGGVDERKMLLISLYASVLVTVICSSVPNYWTLIVTRALLGFSVGSNLNLTGVFFAKRVSSYDVYNLAGIVGGFAVPLAGGWVAILGYLLLTKIGWRWFILCTSVPVFIPPICILHCIPADGNTRIRETSRKNQKDLEVNNFGRRVMKCCMAEFVNKFQGLGSILLIPALLSGIREEDETMESKKFLILALHYGAAKLLGRILAIFLLKLIGFQILQPLIAAITASSYLVLIFQDRSFLVLVIAMAVSNTCYSITASELLLMRYDKHYFGTKQLDLASGLVTFSGAVATAVASIVVMFLSTQTAVITTFILLCALVMIFCSITDR